MTVLHIIDSLGIGGAEKLLVAIINNLGDIEHHVIILSENAPLEKELPAGVPVTKLPFRSKLDTFSTVKFVKRYIKEHHVDIVHSHLVMATTIARLACPKDVKLFNHVHSMVGSRFFGPGKTWQRMIERYAYKKQHHLIAVSKEVLDDYRKYVGIKGPFTVLPNFVEDRFFVDSPGISSFTDKLKLVSIGSLKPAKNYRFLTEAFREIPRNISLDIYGDGPLRNELENEISRYGLNISLKGNANDIPAVLRQYDLFVMSSKVEGHPIALVEAMASGMPTLVSDIPMLREATGNFGLYFDLKGTADFINKVKAIADRKININDYAKHNLAFARKLAGKKDYIAQLRAIYKSK